MWSSSKSIKRSILDKLVETKQYLNLLDNPKTMAIAEKLDQVLMFVRFCSLDTN